MSEPQSRSNLLRFARLTPPPPAQTGRPVSLKAINPSELESIETGDVRLLLIKDAYCEVTISRIIPVVNDDAEILRSEFSSILQNDFDRLAKSRPVELDSWRLPSSFKYAILKTLNDLPIGAKLTAVDAWAKALQMIAEQLSQIAPLEYEQALFRLRITFTEAWNAVAALVAKDAPTADPDH